MSIRWRNMLIASLLSNCATAARISTAAAIGEELEQLQTEVISGELERGNSEPASTKGAGQPSDPQKDEAGRILYYNSWCLTCTTTTTSTLAEQSSGPSCEEREKRQGGGVIAYQLLQYCCVARGPTNAFVYTMDKVWGEDEFTTVSRELQCNPGAEAQRLPPVLSIEIGANGFAPWHDAGVDECKAMASIVNAAYMFYKHNGFVVLSQQDRWPTEEQRNDTSRCTSAPRYGVSRGCSIGDLLDTSIQQYFNGDGPCSKLKQHWTTQWNLFVEKFGYEDELDFLTKLEVKNTVTAGRAFVSVSNLPKPLADRRCYFFGGPGTLSQGTFG